MSETGLEPSMEDLGKAFDGRQKDLVEGKPRESAKQRRKRIAKEIKQKEKVAKAMTQIPIFCVMKTKTIYTFYEDLGKLANAWKTAINNVTIIDPGNPVNKTLSNNIHRCASGLLQVLQVHVQKVEADNLEMQKKQKAAEAKKLEEV